jgi:hypothetical protein
MSQSRLSQVRPALLSIGFASAMALAAACGPGPVSGDDDDDTTTIDAAVAADVDAFSTCANPVPEICNNNIDDDCDNINDCDDADCSNDTHCSNAGCGLLQTPSGSLALPDGACEPTGACAGYENALAFTGFTDGQTLQDITKLLGICVTMEHSWLRDITVQIRCPSGVTVGLSNFGGRTGGEVYLGQANDADSSATPVPGVGWDYCWTPTATREPFIPFANAHPDQLVPVAGHVALPSGDYSSSDSMNALLGCPLNGNWTIRVEDRWGIDNGFIFQWSVRFDPSLVADCSMWPG